MMNKRKTIFNVLFLIIVFSITMYYVLHGQDIKEIIETIRNTDIRYWLPAIVFVVFFIGSESIIIYYMMKSIKQKINLLHCLY